DDLERRHDRARQARVGELRRVPPPPDAARRRQGAHGGARGDAALAALGVALMPETSFIADAAAYCGKVTAKSKSNFYYAFFFLPRDQREALEAVYAYCRLVDDVVDEEAPVEKKLAGIAHWRRELDAVFGDGTPSHPVAAQLREAVKRFPVRREDLEAVI